MKNFIEDNFAPIAIFTTIAVFVVVALLTAGGILSLPN